MNANFLTIFFWFCAGANVSILENCPTESNKYVRIGASVLFMSLFAGLSGACALSEVYKSVWVRVVFGFLWGGMIFNLDRFCVSSMRKRGNIWADHRMAVSRIL